MAEAATTPNCIALSDAAVEILPKINPFAEKFYDCNYNDLQALRALASEYKRATITLGKTILAVDPEAPNPGADLTFREDYNSLLGTTLEV